MIIIWLSDIDVWPFDPQNLISLSLSPRGRNSLDEFLTYHVNKNGTDDPRAHCLRPRLRLQGVVKNRTNDFWLSFIINILSPYILYKFESSTGKKLSVKFRDWKKKGVFISLICTQRSSAGALWESGSCFFRREVMQPVGCLAWRLCGSSLPSECWHKCSFICFQQDLLKTHTS